MRASRATRYILDTCVLRPLLNEKDALYPIIRRNYERVGKSNIWIPVITLVESMTGNGNVLKNNLSAEQAGKLYQIFTRYFEFFSGHQVLDFDEKCWEVYNSLNASYIKSTDKRIAAMVLVSGYTFVTMDKHFLQLGIPETQIIDWTVDPDFGND